MCSVLFVQKQRFYDLYGQCEKNRRFLTKLLVRRELKGVFGNSKSDVLSYPFSKWSTVLVCLWSFIGKQHMLDISGAVGLP